MFKSFNLHKGWLCAIMLILLLCSVCTTLVSENHIADGITITFSTLLIGLILCAAVALLKETVEAICNP